MVCSESQIPTSFQNVEGPSRSCDFDHIILGSWKVLPKLPGHVHHIQTYFLLQLNLDAT